MAADPNLLNYTEEEEEEEDYIDMEVSTISNLFCYSESASQKHPNEFEFQMFSSSSERETTSPADELFYKGKLLPLHLPPRLQMFEKLLENSSPYNHNKNKHSFSFDDDNFNTLSTTTAYATPTENTPFESCNITPFESPQVSKELNPHEYFSEYSTEMSSFVDDNRRKSWAKKLKLGSKLKASQAYLKSFFNKSSSLDQTFARKNDNKLSLKTGKAAKVTPFGQIQREKCQTSITVSKSLENQKVVTDGMARHRRSFSGAIRRFSTTKTLLFSNSSSSCESSFSASSGNSNAMNDSSTLKKSVSVRSDVENSIQGAIAHCKRSQQDFRSRKTASEVGFYSLSTSSLLGCEVQDKPVLCRG